MRIQAFCPRSSVQRLALDGRIRPGFSVTLAAQPLRPVTIPARSLPRRKMTAFFRTPFASTSCRRRPTFRFAFIHRDRGGCRAALHIHRPQRRPPGIRFRFFCFQRHARNLRAVLAFLGRGTKPTFFADDGLQFVSVRIDARRRPTRLPASVKALCLSTTNPSPSRSASCRRLCCSTRKPLRARRHPSGRGGHQLGQRHRLASFKSTFGPRPCIRFRPAGGQAFFSVFIDDANATMLVLQADTDRGTYRHPPT